MSDLNPYPADPYRQGSAGSPYPADFDRASQSASGVSSTRNGYYSADDLGDQSPHFPETQGGQMVPYPGGGRQSYGQAYGQPYSQQYPYPPPSYGPYPPYGQGVYWRAPYDPRRHEANALGGWALGLGIASVFLFCYFGALLGVPAIIVGFKGMRAADEGRSTNKGMSIAGMILGSIGTAISVIYMTSFLILYLSTV